ncbi:alpha/beta hydrolase family esterase [Yoonia sediminilitoris]|uniref:Polyhydroxybutyrate depolymerase n=1 Tax=Yoonia sediminilitoris TaxID=1286148 RepID=A0A2T6KJV7_9RHOB|nr:prolyl oligopeptidase family serine peptidase [Yoonia sediminilitoris]PUB16254.1 polyhydroxybutyrate depolymerase [Yoonia sediminilitoris]RCW96603.1 polyhydroxybutyrate depolymerase [Yoonia sediminilitoris]
MRGWLTAAAFAAFGTSLQAACTEQADACVVTTGTYHIALPDTPDKAPAILWLHGAGGTGAGALRNRGMVDTLIARGYAVIGANGQDRPGRFGTGWYFHPDRPKNRDDIAYLASVADDAAARFGLDRSAMILAGFSVGGSMTSYLACAEPDMFAAYAPVGGSFWKPEPAACNGPVRLMQTHGWKDQTVPLEGRPLGGGRIYQGDVWQAMQVWRAENACDMLRPDTFTMTDRFWRRKWEDCMPGTALEFALHPGGHGIPRGWTAMTLDWFEGLEAEE